MIKITVKNTSSVGVSATAQFFLKPKNGQYNRVHKT
jgi:hypothetical protein